MSSLDESTETESDEIEVVEILLRYTVVYREMYTLVPEATRRGTTVKDLLMTHGLMSPPEIQVTE